MLNFKSVLCVFLNQGSHKGILQCFANMGLSSQRQISSVALMLHRIAPALISVFEKRDKIQ